MREGHDLGRFMPKEIEVWKSSHTVSSIRLDTVVQYLMELKPQTRLDYYELTNGEKSLLRAMCAYSREGAMVDRSLEELARRASLSRKQAQRLLNGYVRDGDRKVMGLKARGIVSELAPANPGRERAATLRINWDALSLDPGKSHILTRRMQMELPGLKSPMDPEVDAQEVSHQAAQKVVKNFLPSGHRVQGPLDNLSTPSGHRVQGPPDNLSREKNLGFSGKSFAQKQKETACLPTSVEMSVWDRLPNWLTNKIHRELRTIAEASVGSSGSNNPETLRRRVLLACERAGVWPHVSEELAEEIYQQAKTAHG